LGPDDFLVRATFCLFNGGVTEHWEAFEANVRN
jgi:hypothetical protein